MTPAVAAAAASSAARSSETASNTSSARIRGGPYSVGAGASFDAAFSTSLLSLHFFPPTHMPSSVVTADVFGMDKSDSFIPVAPLLVSASRGCPGYRRLPLAGQAAAFR